MLDFMEISIDHGKNGATIFPSFLVVKSKDLMIRGGDFYAIWDTDKCMWSTDEQDVVRLVDQELRNYVDEHKDYYGDHVKVRYMRLSRSGVIDMWHRYCKQQLRDNFVMLDEKLIFSNTEVKREDYASHKLDYALSEGNYDAWDILVSTLYSEEERHKIEWAIGAIVSGDSKNIQKFMVLYGAAGTGKSTILNIIQDLFKGYYCVFDAKSLGSSNASFALEAFRSNPLVAIQHDGDLSRIEDNTRLNSLVSHELMMVNEKFKSTYANAFKAFLFMGTNKPVKITDAKSGLIRRLIDVSPSGNKLAVKEYNRLMKQIKFELGAIAYHCLQVYSDNIHYYDDYIPISMMSASNDFYNYVLENYSVFKRDDGITLAAAWARYKQYCEEARVPYPLTRMIFGEELKNYFTTFKLRYVMPDGTRVRSYYMHFKTDKFEQQINTTDQNETSDTNTLELNDTESLLDNLYADYPAQYATDEGIPRYSWKKCYTKLKDLDTSKLHYVKLPLNHIVIDFDIKDENGKKSFALNSAEAAKWPPTYAELSRSGGIHLHYIYDGDATKLAPIYAKDIEVKVWTGDSTLRRKLSKCNNLPIATISSGLQLKEEKKMVTDYEFKNEKHLRNRINLELDKIRDRNNKTGFTKPVITMVDTILKEANAQGLKYDLSDLYNELYYLAAQSSNNKGFCLKLVDNMQLTSIDEEDQNESIVDERPTVVFDVEVFPNLFVVCYKYVEDDVEDLADFKTKQLKPVTKLINPNPEVIEELMQTCGLVGFNNLLYDNHIIFARAMGYSIMELYQLSKNMIKNHKGYINMARNISKTDIYDFASATNKMSLKKLEIKMGINHDELGLDWDKPVPVELWGRVAEYCANDVIATEAAFIFLKGDYAARKILCSITNLSENTSTNQLSIQWILEGNKNARESFLYRDLSQPVMSLDPEVEAFLKEIKPDMMKQRHGPAKSLLPYFPGYKFEYGKSTYKFVNEDSVDDKKQVGEGGRVYANKGIWRNVGLWDVESEHPNSIDAECLFGVYYTRRYNDILMARLAIKHGEYDKAETMMGGILKPYIQLIREQKMSKKDLTDALKTAINSVYGLTSKAAKDGKTPNPFRDERNVDNIVAKRGALFMIDLQEYVESLGYTVVHIKTDSIKVANANMFIGEKIVAFGLKYGYTFNHEAVYDRMCLVTDADYIAKYATEEFCMEQYGYVPDDNQDHGGKWTATGKRFKEPYVFKSMFSGEQIIFEDMCSVMSVDKGAIYLDNNESFPDVSAQEKALDKCQSDYKKGKISDMTYESTVKDLISEIEKGHNYIFVGRVGQFCPMLPGANAGWLQRGLDGKYSFVAGSKGYRWMESETVHKLGIEDKIDKSYYDNLVAEAAALIAKYGDVDEFINGEDAEPELPF